MSDPYHNVAVIGSGSWGTAVAVTLAESGADVVLWGREPAVAESVNERHENPRYLSGVRLPVTLRATTDLAEAAARTLRFVVVPSSAVRPVTAAMAETGVDPGPDATLVACSKGIEKGSGLRMSQIIAEHFPEQSVAVLSGPNHAEEVALHQAAAAVIGCGDHDVAVALQNAISVPWFRTYTSDDVTGMEWAGAAKNVFAISAGIVDGLGLGDNAKAALVTRGLAEMVRLGVAHGGRPETFSGLSGVGDLMVTCYSQHSRNNRLGRMLGEGIPLDEAVASMKMVAEGVPNTESIYGEARRAGVRTPLIDAAYSVLYEGRRPLDVLEELLSRDPRPENG